MPTDLNLATRPFRNRTLPWVITTVIACASIVALLLILNEARQVGRRTELIERKLQALRAEREKIRALAAEVKSTLTPEQLRSIEDAHALIDRKRFSWSQLFADLERAMPTSVYVTRISVRDISDPHGAADGVAAELEMAIIGRTPDDVTRMISEMDRTAIFSADPLTQNTRTGKGESGTEWTLRVRYVQRSDTTEQNREALVSSAVTPRGDDGKRAQ